MKNLKRITLLIITLITVLQANAKDYDFVVAQDGSGDFKTVQEAINAVPDLRKKRTTIFIKNGVYKEKLVMAECKRIISFIGESAEKTILTYDDYASKKNRFGEEMGTSSSSSFFIYSSDFTAKNITFQNSAGPVGQAVAIWIAGSRAKFENCRFLGFQDTLYTYGKGAKQFYKNCYIEGTVDFIFGSSTAYFENCEIHAKRTGGYLTAASTPEGQEYGYVFHNCKLTADKGVEKVMLGRPWRPYAQTVFIDCKMENFIAPEGWFNWGVEKEKTAYYGEIHSVNMKGKPVDVSSRVAWSHQLEPDSKYDIDKVLADKDNKDWYK